MMHDIEEEKLDLDLDLEKFYIDSILDSSLAPEIREDAEHNLIALANSKVLSKIACNTLLQNIYDVNCKIAFITSLSLSVEKDLNPEPIYLEKLSELINDDSISYMDRNRVLSAIFLSIQNSIFMPVSVVENICKALSDSELERRASRSLANLLDYQNIDLPLSLLEQMSNKLSDESTSSYLKENYLLILFRLSKLNKEFNVNILNNLEKIISDDYYGKLALYSILNTHIYKGDDELVEKYKSLLNHFNESESERKVGKLIDSIFEQNTNLDLIELVKSDYFKTELFNIQNSYSSINTFNNKPIKDWSKSDIENWSKFYRDNPIKPTSEILAVIKKACEIDNLYSPRDIQIITLLTMIKLGSDFGVLGQVNTGEGKSLIIAMLAIYKVLNGEKVDIITSSSVLALRDKEEKQSLYSMFGITIGDNGDISDLGNIKKDCYSKDVVYGSIENFQFDYLKDEHFNLGIRSSREFSCAIVDEVDSMLVDGGGNIARLSGKMPGMELLGFLITCIWDYLGEIDLNYFEVDGQLMWKNFNEDGALKIDNRLKFTSDLLEEYVYELINGADGCKIEIPRHLESLVSLQIKKWTKSAILAKYLCKENCDYLIVDKIGSGKSLVPVDYSNTGIVQISTEWQNGLHQFLQLKHGLSLKPESLTTSFISNIEYFKKYGNKVFGLTGTLGSGDTIDLLEDIYSIKTVFFPPHQTSKLHKLDAILCNGNEQWCGSIIDTIFKEIRQNRSVLVICETIESLNSIKLKLIENRFPTNKLSIYSRNDNEEVASIKKIVEIGEIILATNLAGRGTDIKTTEKLEENGGLHICLTFMPTNKRVEDQAFGRTARKGNEGTVQLVVDIEEALLKIGYSGIKSINTIEELLLLRDSIEGNRLENIQTENLNKILISDIFSLNVF
jgi:preprotein translocase subunit SecA